jgi:hypothetical protein
MIETVEQTPFQRMEAASPDSLARNMLAALIRREREARRNFQDSQKRSAEDPMGVDYFARWIEIKNCTETVRRILYGWEQ